MDHYPPSTPLQGNCPPGSDSMQRLVVHLDLFSGIGGFALAAQMAGGIKTIGFSEIEPYACRVLAKNFPNIPNYGDIRNIRNIKADIITGGYPCQPFSTAGARTGSDDERHLWPEMLRIIAEVSPTWVIAENVVGHATMGLDQVCSDLEALGRSTRVFAIPACAVGAPHIRERLWVVSHAKGKPAAGETRNIPAEDGENEQEQAAGWIQFPVVATGGNGGAHWKREPGVPRVADGLPDWVDRNRGLGNAIVPQVAAEILRCLMDVEKSGQKECQNSPENSQ